MPTSNLDKKENSLDNEFSFLLFNFLLFNKSAWPLGFRYSEFISESFSNRCWNKFSMTIKYYFNFIFFFIKIDSSLRLEWWNFRHIVAFAEISTSVQMLKEVCMTILDCFVVYVIHFFRNVTNEIGISYYVETDLLLPYKV